MSEFAITDFMRLKECNAEWVTNFQRPPFYHTHRDISFVVVVYPNGKSYAKVLMHNFRIFLMFLHLSPGQLDSAPCTGEGTLDHLEGALLKMAYKL